MTSDPFEQHVDRYEQWFDRNPEAYEAELRAVASQLPPDAVGIEIGVGTGRFASPLGIRLGVEPSAAMGAMARRRGIDVIQGVAECLPFPDASFDFVLMVATLCVLDDARLSFHEAYRVLKDGGSLIVGFIDAESCRGREYQNRKADSVFYRDARFYSADEVLGLFESTGFEDLSCVQTLFPNQQFQTPDAVCPGHGEGSFVVLKGAKPVPKGAPKPTA
jgi:SAM-dependent methyltransferase